ncbi:CDP-glucose 4,6-dehydratase [Streptomyces pathocidini]|uniref:CDP-glucose 4,6-dehydratase n=1 Tax=Streptomyces pathocidini TaxID=1650571 RepID=UPI00340D764C
MPVVDAGLTSRWRGRRVLMTGHSGFIGSWLALTLRKLGAEVHGFALNGDRQTQVRHAWLADRGVRGAVGDVRDFDAVHHAMTAVPYDAVFHLAAQPLVRAGLDDPRETLSTNIDGSINVLEAARRCEPTVLVHVTSDKCYRNRAWPWPYRETDDLGGGCPYSVSKAAAEVVFEGYAELFGDLCPRTASVRFGNVIGGGDFADRRLVPDAMAALRAGQPIRLRRPTAVRPWQHVLDVVHGLLLLADHLADEVVKPGTVYNFAPPGDGATARELAHSLAAHWSKTQEAGAPTSAAADVEESEPLFAEEELLRLDGRRAAEELGWRHRFTLDASAAAIVDWHRSVDNGARPDETTTRQIDAFLDTQAEGWQW